MGWACLGKTRWRWALNVWGYCYMCKERPRQVQPINSPPRPANHHQLRGVPKWRRLQSQIANCSAILMEVEGPRIQPLR